MNMGLMNCACIIANSKRVSFFAGPGNKVDCLPLPAGNETLLLRKEFNCSSTSVNRRWSMMRKMQLVTVSLQAWDDSDVILSTVVTAAAVERI